MQMPSWLTRQISRIVSRPTCNLRLGHYSRSAYVHTSQPWRSSSEDARHCSLRQIHFDNFKRAYNIKPNLQLRPTIKSSQVGERHTVVGFLKNINRISSRMIFGKIEPPYEDCVSGAPTIQILYRLGASETSQEAIKILEDVTVGSSVSVTGILQWKKGFENQQVSYEHGQPICGEHKTSVTDTELVSLEKLEIMIEDIQCINSFPNDIDIGPNSNYGSESRHLEIRLHPASRHRLSMRSKMMKAARSSLSDFTEIETPLLFKSTPEGAREFLVPTRKAGYAYSLPQSPQQYKQILMASGISKYFQFAKCFRDEDYRADRQPEFTQLDLEISWADGESVMKHVAVLVQNLYRQRGYYPAYSEFSVEPKGWPQGPSYPIPQMTYEQAMSGHGSDKPDLRIRNSIHRIDHIVPDSLTRTMTSIVDPIVDVWKFSPPSSQSFATVQSFIRSFMDSTRAATFRNNPDGSLGVFVIDQSRPLNGLSAFGFEGAEQLESYLRDLDVSLSKAKAQRKSSITSPQEIIFPAGVDVEDLDAAFAASPMQLEYFKTGDVLFVQARKKTPFSGGSTILGKFRSAIWKAALEQGIVQEAPRPRLLWITDFPLFSRSDDSDEPGQGGRAGFSSTHHPFTAPKSAEDVDLLFTDPLKAKADHYDLVMNGVELGGGSRRIHDAGLQEYVMRDVLKMPEPRIKEFSHLLEALRSGCPPHAGFALGWDRLMSLMLGTESIRDVMAFPKNPKGEDTMIGSPGRMTSDQLDIYHLKVIEAGEGKGAGTLEAEKGVDEGHMAGLELKPLEMAPTDSKPICGGSETITKPQLLRTVHGSSELVTRNRADWEKDDVTQQMKLDKKKVAWEIEGLDKQSKMVLLEQQRWAEWRKKEEAALIEEKRIFALEWRRKSEMVSKERKKWLNEKRALLGKVTEERQAKAKERRGRAIGSKTLLQPADDRYSLVRAKVAEARQVIHRIAPTSISSTNEMSSRSNKPLVTEDIGASSTTHPRISFRHMGFPKDSTPHSPTAWKPNQLTCYYWAKGGGCFEEGCRFRHEWVEAGVAPPPGRDLTVLSSVGGSADKEQEKGRSEKREKRSGMASLFEQVEGD